MRDIDKDMRFKKRYAVIRFFVGNIGDIFSGFNCNLVIGICSCFDLRRICNGMLDKLHNKGLTHYLKVAPDHRWISISNSLVCSWWDKNGFNFSPIQRRTKIYIEQFLV